MRLLVLFLLGVAVLGAEPKKTAVELRVDRARNYAQRGQEYVSKANAARTSTRLSDSSRENLYRQNLGRAASALRRARSMVRGRKDPLSSAATTEFTASLVKVLNSQARVYLDKQSLSRASRLVKEVLKLHPKNPAALLIAREIEEAKRKDPTASGGTSGSAASRRWRARRKGTGAGGAGTRGRGGGGRR